MPPVALIFIVHPVALMVSQVLIVYIFRMDMANSNRVMSEILVQLGENY